MAHRHLRTACLTLGLGLTLGVAGTAGAKTYSLAAGSGGQLQIGGGLPLPAQATCNATCTGTVFPPLLIPVVPSATVSGTTAKSSAQKIVVPKGVLSKPAAFKILGQFVNNPNLYAVATNLRYTWPAAPATFSTAARTGATTTVKPGLGVGQSIRYSNVLARKFGGPAQFALSPGTPGAPGGAGAPGDLNPAAPVTLYAIPPPLRPIGNPPCTHAAFAGTGGPFPGGDPVGGINVNGFCVAAIGLALPTGVAAAGGGQPGAPAIVSTPGGTPTATAVGGPVPGVGVVKAGTGALHPAGPPGTISLFAYTGPSGMGFTNMASSAGFPWTTGMLTIKATLASGAPETWMVTGKDSRTAAGAGTIQMVSGALSLRTTTLDNANRGWVRLILEAPAEVPALTPSALMAMAALMLLLAGYAMRRRFAE